MVRSWIEAPREELDAGGPAVKSYWMQWESLTLVDGLAYRRFERPDGSCQYLQLLMPRSVRHVFLKMVHMQLTGHLWH